MARFLLIHESRMRTFPSPFWIFLLVVQQTIPFFNAKASGLTKTMVIQSVQGAAQNEAAEKTAEVLRQKLVHMPSLYLVDPKKVEEVLSYYQNYLLHGGSSEVEEAKDLLAKAMSLYFQFAYSEALSELNRAIQIFDAHPKEAYNEGQIYLDSWVTLALVHSALGQKEESLRDFEKVLQINPFYRLDEKSFAPSLHKLFAEAKSNLEKSPAAVLEVTTDPKVAEIYINGIYQGVSPQLFSAIPAGNYTVVLKANNYETVQRSVELKPGQKTKFSGKLVWNVAPKKQTLNDLATAKRQTEEGLRVAELLKADKVLMVQVDSKNIALRLVDRQYRTSHTPIFIGLNEPSADLEKNLEQGARLVYAQTQMNLLKNPSAKVDEGLTGDPILLGHRSKKISKGVLFGGLGVLGVGGLVAGILSATGGSDAPKTGSLALSFK